MNNLVMVIEDEEDLSLLLSYNLEKEGYQVATVFNGSDAVSEIERLLPSVIILDWMLPEISGVEICKLIRSKPDIKNIPIIMLTAKSQEEDKIKGLSAGADDYVTKPFSIPELMARVKTNMRRAPLFEEKEKSIIFEDIYMDLVERKVKRGDNYLHLSPTEFRLLKMLIKEPGKVFSREVLLKSIWGDNIYVESRTVDVHIRRLRRALNKYGPDYIRTVRANGYSIDKNANNAEDDVAEDEDISD
ncbi:MAG: response regulator [Alphaproteobacteria bacterium]|nr:response regulator [Alphaproteobacteria bacterium]